MSVDLRLSWLPANRGLWRLLVDVLLLGGLLILCTQLSLLWAGTTQRGFFCDDDTLMYPYKENTVTSNMLHWLTLYLPLAVLMLVEIYRCWGAAYRPAYNTIRWFLFGHFAERLLKDMGKQMIGRLRPHFFDVCRPLLQDGGSCTDDAHRQGGVYHTVYTCQAVVSGATADMLRDVHVSFPSGHSSMAFYGLVFLALHLQRIRWPLTRTLLRPLCQLLCVGLASFIGLSRVMDYKHHWSDVAAGSLLGASIALAVVRAAAEEQRLPPVEQQQQQQHANAVKAALTGSASGAAAEATSSVAGSEQGRQQLPHDLCVVTCHSSN